MVRTPKAPLGPSHLTKVLAHLTAPPKLVLPGLKSLKLSLAFRNDHFGARHFMRDHLPRIRYANPDLPIEVEKVLKTKEEVWRPELTLTFANASTRTLSLNSKLSTTIVLELMDAAGGDPWRKWKAEATLKNLPIVPGEELISEMVKGRVAAKAIKDEEMEKKSSTPAPGLDAFRASRGGKGTNGSKTSIPPPVKVTDGKGISASP